MSSDEEGPRHPLSGRRRFISHRKHFVAQEVSDLGHHLDRLSHKYHLLRRYDRVQGDPVQTDIWIDELPVDAYDQAWYRSLSPFEKDMLNAQPEYGSL